MLHIILVILKIVGILIGILLLLLLLTLGCVLFVPLRYRVNVSKGSDGTEICGKISWLLHCITLTAAYMEGRFTLGLKILFFKKALISGEDEPPDAPKSRKNEKPRKEEQDSTATEQAAHTEDKPAKNTEQGAPPGKTEQKTEPEKVPHKDKRRQKTDRIAQSTKEKTPGLTERLKNAIGKIKGMFQKAGDFISFLRSDALKSVVRRFRQHLLYLWKHLKPDSIQGNLRYGFEDPALTGELTGILYILLTVGDYEISLNPDFDNAILEGEVNIRGHIRLCHLALIAWKVFRDKEFRAILKRFRS